MSEEKNIKRDNKNIKKIITGQKSLSKSLYSNSNNNNNNHNKCALLSLSIYVILDRLIEIKA